jgi:hypothetical protein
MDRDIVKVPEEADNGNEQNSRDIMKTTEGRYIGTYGNPVYLGKQKEPVLFD